MNPLYYPKLKISRIHFDKPLLKLLFSNGRFMFLHGLATQIILNTDRLVIGKVVSLAAVTVFSITVRIPEVGLSLLSRVTENATPAVMEIVTHESSDRAREQYRRVLLLTSTLGALAFWLILCFNQWFITLWVGPSFFASNLVLSLALVLMVQQTIVRSMSFFLYAKGNSRQLSLMSLFEAGLNIALSVFLGQQIGLPGVLVGTLIASSLTSSWYTPYLLKKYLAIPLRDSWSSILVPAAGISVAGGVVYMLVQWAQVVLPNTVLLFGLLGCLAGVLLAAFTWLVFLRRPFGPYVPARLQRILLVVPLS
ncbi:lipopolysaccharide biosynthesis protein [Hymenobacter glacieicola]|nr:oligosaccharide flippase family protein [Hymenobacter glacieicola]